MGRLYLRMSFFCRSLTHHWLFECIVYLLMMLSALLVSLEASRLVHACLHTHKLGTLGKLACSQLWVWCEREVVFNVLLGGTDELSMGVVDPKTDSSFSENKISWVVGWQALDWEGSSMADSLLVGVQAIFSIEIALRIVACGLKPWRWPLLLPLKMLPLAPIALHSAAAVFGCYSEPSLSPKPAQNSSLSLHIAAPAHRCPCTSHALEHRWLRITAAAHRMPLHTAAPAHHMPSSIAAAAHRCP